MKLNLDILPVIGVLWRGVGRQEAHVLFDGHQGRPLRDDHVALGTLIHLFSSLAACSDELRWWTWWKKDLIGKGRLIISPCAARRIVTLQGAGSSAALLRNGEKSFLLGRQL
jgi:hypothetical protein